MKYRVTRRWAVPFVLGFVLAVSGTVGADGLDPQALDRVVRATVFVKTQRVFQRQEFPASGSGVFISPEGYVLTNWHVVADQFSGWIWGKEHEISSKVLSLSVVVDSGTPQEREIPAVVVARNRKLDLALLRTNHHPKAWVDLSEIPDVHLAQKIWIVGFPYGKMLASFKDPDKLEPESNPEVSITSGMVTSIRHDRDGRIAAIQIDAPVNPGNSGGPMLDENGRVVGVVFAKWAAGEGLGLAVPPEHIRRFLADQLLKVRFTPTTIVEPPSPIRITVYPLLSAKRPASGRAILEGADIPDSVGEFVPGEDGAVEATVPFPERVPGVDPPDHYRVTVELFDAGGMRVFRRRYRLKRVNTPVSKLRSERRPDRMMEDRRLFGNEMEIKDYVRSRKAAGEETRSLAAVAKELKLRREESGSVVIDNNTLRDVTGFVPVPGAYEALGREDWETWCREYDAAVYRLRKDSSRLRELKNAKPVTSTLYGALVAYFVPWSNERISESERRRLIAQHTERIQKERRLIIGLIHKIERARLFRCPDGKWYPREKTPCGYPVLPSP